MTQHSTRQQNEWVPPGTGPAVVDVSNVCWSSELAPRGHQPNLDRLLRLVEAWRALHGADTPMRFVADRSLRHCLSGPDLARWRGVAEELGIEAARVADVNILEYAEAEGLTVLSQDRFVDHRRAHPWIERHPERFVGWRTVDGTVTFAPTGIVPVEHQVVSRLEETKELKGAGLDPRRDRDVLHTRWRCDNPDCLQARMWQDALLLLPAMDTRGRACCPTCRGALTSLGPRGRTRQIIVTAVGDPTELLRFPLEEGTPLVVGRGRLDNGISLDALPRPPERVGRLSRQHVVLRLGGDGVLEVVDLGSRNGTTVHRKGSADAGVDGRPLTADAPVRLGDHDHVQLARVIRLELSGRRFVADTRRPEGATAEAGPTVVSPVDQADAGGSVGSGDGE